MLNRLRLHNVTALMRTRAMRRYGASLEIPQLEFVRGRVNVYLRSGRPARVRRMDDRRSATRFRAGDAFCRVHWTGNDYGTRP